MPEWFYDEMLDCFSLCDDVAGAKTPSSYRIDEKSGQKYYDYDVPKRFTYETPDYVSEEWRRMFNNAKVKERLQIASFDSQEAFETYTFHWLGFHSTRSVNYWYGKKAKELELAIKELFETIGFEVSRTGNPNDGGIDLRTSKGTFNLFIQCKGLGKKLGVGPVREAIGIKHNYMTNFAIVCPNGFSASAMSLAKENNIVLLDAHQLIDLARGHLNALQSANILSLGKP